MNFLVGIFDLKFWHKVVIPGFAYKDYLAHHRVGFSYYVDDDSGYVSVSVFIISP